MSNKQNYTRNLTLLRIFGLQTRPEYIWGWLSVLKAAEKYVSTHATTASSLPRLHLLYWLKAIAKNEWTNEKRLTKHQPSVYVSSDAVFTHSQSFNWHKRKYCGRQENWERFEKHTAETLEETVYFIQEQPQAGLVYRPMTI